MIDYVIRVKIDSGFLTTKQGTYLPNIEMWTGKVTAGISTDEVVMVDDDQFIQVFEHYGVHYGNDIKLTGGFIDGLNEQERKVLNILT